jgi:hypothetical protein
MVIMDYFAYGLDNLAFYLDQRATDAFLSTARTQDAVTKLTRQLGYKMRPATAASVDLSISLAKAYPFQITIPKGFQFKGPNNIIYEAAHDQILNDVPNNAVSLSCSQSVSYTESFVSDGTPNQKFNLRLLSDGQLLVSGSVQVLVNNVSYTEQNFLVFPVDPKNTAGQNQFEVSYTTNPPYITFGDGLAGGIPTPNASITVQYSATKGASGRANQNTITSSALPLVINSQTIKLNINNTRSTVGGDNAETLSEAQANAPSVFATRQVAVTQSDYISLSTSYASPQSGRVAVARAFITSTAMEDLVLLAILKSVYKAGHTTQTGIAASTNSTTSNAAAAIASLGSIDTQLANIAAVSGPLAVINTNLTAVINNINAASTNSSKIATGVSLVSTESTTNIPSYKSTISSNVASISTLIHDIVTSVQSTYTVTARQMSDLATYVGAIKDANTLLATTVTNLNVALTNLGLTDALTTSINNIANNQVPAIKSALATLGSVSPSSGYLGSLNTDVGILNTNIPTITDNNNAIIALNTGTGNFVDSLGDPLSNVVGSLNSVMDHVTSLFLSDCGSNVVTVPILSKNSDGFYAAPTQNLVADLQHFLDNVKDVAHTVLVTDGSGYLVPAVLTVQLGVSSKYNLAAVTASVSSAIDSLLRNRAFGQTLYNSDVYTSCMSQSGVVYATVTINGYLKNGVLFTDKISESNLVATDQDIITKGINLDGSSAITIKPLSVKVS